MSAFLRPFSSWTRTGHDSGGGGAAVLGHSNHIGTTTGADTGNITLDHATSMTRGSSTTASSASRPRNDNDSHEESTSSPHRGIVTVTATTTAAATTTTTNNTDTIPATTSSFPTPPTKRDGLDGPNPHHPLLEQLQSGSGESTTASPDPKRRRVVVPWNTSHNDDDSSDRHQKTTRDRDTAAKTTTTPTTRRELDSIARRSSPSSRVSFHATTDTTTTIAASTMTSPTRGKRRILSEEVEMVVMEVDDDTNKECEETRQQQQQPPGHAVQKKRDSPRVVAQSTSNTTTSHSSPTLKEHRHGVPTHVSSAIASSGSRSSPVRMPRKSTTTMGTENNHPTRGDRRQLRRSTRVRTTRQPSRDTLVCKEEDDDEARNYRHRIKADDNSSDDGDDKEEMDYNNKDNNDDDEEDDENQTRSMVSRHPRKPEPPPSMRELAHCCWKCHVPLTSTAASLTAAAAGKSVEGDQVCCYAQHIHELLQTPMCVVCVEQLDARPERNNHNDDDDDSSTSPAICTGCGLVSDDEDDNDCGMVFLCDFCPHSFCDRCVVQAYGYRDIVNTLQQTGDGEPWHCLLCQPPDALKTLQEQLQKQQQHQQKRRLQQKLDDTDGSDDEDSHVAGEDEASSQNGNDERPYRRQRRGRKRKRHRQDLFPSRSIEDVIGELAVAEDKKKQCLQAMDTFDPLIKRAIRTELYTKQGLRGSVLQETLREESELWMKEQQDHLYRLNDFIATLQDELEVVHDVDIAYCYNDILKLRETIPKNIPDWVRAADEEIAARKKNEPLPDSDFLDPSAYDEECYDDVVEIAGIDDDDDDMDNDHARDAGYIHRQGWSRRSKPRKEQIRQAYEAEQERVASLQIPKIRTIHEQQDRQECVKEIEEVTCLPGKMMIRSKRRVATTRDRDTNHSTTLGSASPSMHANELRTPSSSSKNRNSDKLDKSKGHEQDPVFLCDTEEEEEKEDSSCHNKLVSSFANRYKSDLVLSSRPLVFVDQRLVKDLKPHQVEGVKFLWRNCFSDLGDEPGDLGGCILAHNMGLGKTFTAIATLYTALTNPALINKETQQHLLRTVLLVVPVNTLTNWEQEVDKWVGELSYPLLVHNFSFAETSRRKRVIRQWNKKGGILLLGSNMCTRLMKDDSFKDLLQPDVLVLDEAHTMLKSTTTEVFKALSGINTKRRILMTGSPFQNNLLEYYRMCEFIRPGVFGVANEAQFEREFVDPIVNGLASDSSRKEQAMSIVKSADLNEMLKPYIHRKDVTVLSQDLPALTQAVLHVRPSRVQTRLYQAFQLFKRKNEEFGNFFRMYQELKPIHNHPKCLTMKSERQIRRSNSMDDRRSLDDGDAECTTSENSSWWEPTVKKMGQNQLDNVESGSKIVLLLHILAYASKLGEKVLIFSQCLKTLDLIEHVLAIDNWKQKVKSLECFKGMSLGGWKKNQDFLRIDGDISGSSRGELVDAFNSTDTDGNFRAFLISSLAGGVGINLTAASRVVLVDSHFNPSVMTQAVFRAYRYGQEKPVFCYRLLTEGTIEEKVYGRSVNKTGISLRVIDSKSINRCFSQKELADLQKSLLWAQCDRCGKWRMLLGESQDDLPDVWFCEMNSDTRNNNCKNPERDQLWYENNCNLDQAPSPEKHNDKETTKTETPAVIEDELLRHLLTVSDRSQGTSLVSRHYYHDSLLRTTQDSVEEVDMARQWLEEAAKQEREVQNCSDLQKTAEVIATINHTPTNYQGLSMPHLQFQANVYSTHVNLSGWMPPFVNVPSTESTMKLGFALQTPPPPTVANFPSLPFNAFQNGLPMVPTVNSNLVVAAQLQGNNASVPVLSSDGFSSMSLDDNGLNKGSFEVSGTGTTTKLGNSSFIPANAQSSDARNRQSQDPEKEVKVEIQEKASVVALANPSTVASHQKNETESNIIYRSIRGKDNVSSRPQSVERDTPKAPMMPPSNVQSSDVGNGESQVASMENEEKSLLGNRPMGTFYQNVETKAGMHQAVKNEENVPLLPQTIDKGISIDLSTLPAVNAQDIDIRNGQNQAPAKESKVKSIGQVSSGASYKMDKPEAKITVQSTSIAETVSFYSPTNEKEIPNSYHDNDVTARVADNSKNRYPGITGTTEDPTIFSGPPRGKGARLVAMKTASPLQISKRTPSVASPDLPKVTTTQLSDPDDVGTGVNLSTRRSLTGGESPQDPQRIQASNRSTDERSTILVIDLTGSDDDDDGATYI